MQYMILIYEDEAGYGDQADSPEMQAIVARHYELAGSIGDRMKGGGGLQPVATATTVRTEGGRQTIHDGPFAETREQLGGYYVIEAADLDEAIAFAERVPIRLDGSIEIRPLITE